MKRINRLIGLAVVSWAPLAYVQLDAGDCGVTNLTCDLAGTACTASDGKSGTCVQQRQGCSCATFNLCHLDRVTHTYSGIRVSGRAMTAHRQHGDCTIDDGVDCTIDRCDPTLGCVSAPDDTRCDDGLFCTTESCSADGCAAVSTCPQAIDGCIRVNDSCDEDNDRCVDRADDELCDDGDLCNGLDVCDSATGDCVIDAYLFCDDFSRCTTDSCDSALGCVFTPVSCDDGAPCTDDSCNALTGCQHTPVDCSDGDFCNGLETCDHVTGDCFIDSYLFCNDFNHCTSDSCNPETGCVHTAVSCDDQNVCTADSCNPLVGCQHENVIVCNYECRGQECDPASGICGPVLANGTACDDGNECTTGDACYQALCTGTPCTAPNTCCPGRGCANLAADNANCGACGNACMNSTCFQGSCFAGCVISGVAYNNGVRNPDNPCEACDPNFSRIGWKPLHTESSCSLGCFTGQCFQGACASFGGSGGGCLNTTCATSSCVNNHCVFTPRNEGATCTPPLSTSICQSGTTGTCQNGLCIGAAQNVGGFCIPEASSVPTGSQRYCFSSTSGACNSTGQCDPNILTGASCYDPQFAPCRTGECMVVSGIYGCWFDTEPACEAPHDYCGPDGTCNTQTQQCSYPGPYSPPNNGFCGNFASGPQQHLCCPGQVCVCPPSPSGPTWCVEYYCYWPDELPD